MLAHVNVDNYQGAVDWCRTHVYTNFGKLAARAAFDPCVERWYFYDADNTLIVAVPHESVDRLYELFLLRAAREQAIKAKIKTKTSRA